MRHPWLPCLLAVLCARPAGASDKGDFTLFAKRPFGDGLFTVPGPVAAYQLTPHLELQPVFGLSFVRQGTPRRSHFHYDLGLRGFYSLRPGKRLVPYLGGGLTFSHVDNRYASWTVGPDGRIVSEDVPPPPPGWSANHVSVTTALGLRAWVTPRFGVFAELGASRTLDHGGYRWTGQAWERRPATEPFHPFRSGFGFMFNLHK